MQFRALLAVAAILGVTLAAPMDRLKQREEASPAANTMYSFSWQQWKSMLNIVRYYEKDFDETAVKREEASPAANTM